MKGLIGYGVVLLALALVGFAVVAEIARGVAWIRWAFG